MRRWAWTGPLDSDLDSQVLSTLKHPVPGDRWPYGPPGDHQDCCSLHGGGLFCDCAASATDQEDDD